MQMAVVHLKSCDDEADTVTSKNSSLGTGDPVCNLEHVCTETCRKIGPSVDWLPWNHEGMAFPDGCNGHEDDAIVVFERKMAWQLTFDDSSEESCHQTRRVVRVPN